MLKASSRLLQCRITFFTRSPCSLCDTAKTVVQNVKSKRDFEYNEINVMEPGQEKWKHVYEFDTPVIHIDKASASETTTSALKLMHRFKEDEVVQKMDEAECLWYLACGHCGVAYTENGEEGSYGNPPQATMMYRLRPLLRNYICTSTSLGCNSLSSPLSLRNFARFSSTSANMNSLQEASRIFKAFRKGGATFGGWQMLPGTNHSRAIARSGVDWICVDCEHGNIDDGQMHEAVAAIAATGVSPIVRIAANEAWMVKRALDCGAHGIVVPLIYTVNDAKRLVSSAKFPPEGHRGFGSPFTPQTFTNEPLTHYLQNANSSLITIVQIETKSALESVHEIAAVPGVDCLLIGPFDLGNNIGRPILGSMHPELIAAIDSIKDAAHAAGKKVGIYCTSGEQAREYAEKGFDMISIAADLLAVTAYFSQTLETASGGKMKGEGKAGTGAGYDGR